MDVETRECFQKVFQKLDQSNEQITLLRIEHAKNKIKLQNISNKLKFWSRLHGLVGGALGTISYAVVEHLRK